VGAIVRLVLGGGVKLAAIAWSRDSRARWAATRLVRTMLGSAWSAPIRSRYGAMAVGVAVVTVGGVRGPGVAASRVDPLVALRQE